MSFREHLGRIAARAFAALAMAGALASCGGSTYQVNPFNPQRLLSFGDESSLLVGPQALKYSINGVNATTNVVDCTQLPLWIQVLANSYNLMFSNCNWQEIAQPNAFQYATVGATVDDVQTQVQTFLSGDSFNGNDLVTVWAGANDVVNEYLANGSSNDVPTLTADMKAKGAQLAGVVNEIANAGGKVVLLTIPDMGLSPFAATENQRGDFDRAALLTAMSDAFNVGLRANVINDGSKVGLVLPDDFVKSAARNPAAYSLIAQPNVTAGCMTLAPLPDCTQNTLVTDPSLNSNAAGIFLWADATHLGSTAQAAIGSLAVARSHTNPF